MSDDSSGWTIVAIGIAALLALTGVGLCVGLIIAFAKGSILLSIPWVMPATTVAGAGGVVVGVTVLTVKVFKQAVKEPFYWAMPVLSVAAAVAVDFGKELYEGDGPLVKLLFGGLILLLFVVGGTLWRMKPVLLRISGCLCFVLPLVLVCFKYAQAKGLPLWKAVCSIHVDSSVFASLVVLILMSLTSLALCYYVRNDQ